MDGIGKQGCDFAITKSGYATTNARDEEGELAVLASKSNELIYLGLNSAHAALHGGNSIRAPG